MKKLTVIHNLSGFKDEGGDLVRKIVSQLMTPDMAAASAAGCRLEVTAENTEKGMTIRMRTVEKVSILKMPDGQPISVIVKR